MRINVNENQRAIVLIDGVPNRYLTPGRHSIFAPFKDLTVEMINVSGLVCELSADRLALIPAEDLSVINVAPSERAVVYRRGRPVLWLGAGVHQIWTVDRGFERATKKTISLVRIDVLDTSSVQAKLLDAEVAALVKPKSDYVEVLVPEGHSAVRTIDGQFDTALGAGRHAVWNTTRNVGLSVVDLRERALHVTGQEVMTRDRVTLRLNVSATLEVHDVKRVASVARNADELVYLALQLAAREAVTQRTLDELLAAREALVEAMRPAVQARAESLGFTLMELGLKDLVLPGEMKDLLNKVIGAQKEAEANVILRREETAATRSLAQTAKVLQENPLLIRLKELEAYKELAAKVGKVHLVMGEGALPSLQLK